MGWNTWVYYATFHLPPEPNGFYVYNPLQQIAYFSVVFVFGPLANAWAIASSEVGTNRFHCSVVTSMVTKKIPVGTGPWGIAVVKRSASR